MKALIQYIIYCFVGLLIVPFFTSCGVVFDIDITDETITLISPTDSNANDFETQIFLWEENQMVDEYELQVARGTFENNSQMVVNESTTDFTYSVDLEPGDYQWRVRGVNNSYETDYTTHTLRVDSSYDISNEEIVYYSPAEDQMVFNISSVTLSWQRVPLATSYTVFVESISANWTYSRTEVVNTNQFSLTNFIDITNLEDDVSFQWRVTAHNNISNTQTIFNQGRVFTIDVPEENQN